MKRGFVSVVVVLIALLFCPLVDAQETKHTAEDLFRAARSGDVDLIKEILGAGIDVDSKSAYGATALSFAAEQGHLDAVKTLVENGADVNVKDTFYNASPLTWANMSKHTEISEFLKENGAELPTFRRPSSSRTTNKDADEEEEEIEFLPSSSESRMADRKVSHVNWPQFRGMGSRGIADGQHPPLTWNVEEKKNVLWKTPIEGLGHSCPVIWEDRIYLTSAISGKGDHSIKIGNYGGVGFVEDDSEHTFIVVCVDKNSGEVLWQQTATEAVPAVKRHLKSTHANSTVATDGEHVIAWFGSEGLYCYSKMGDLIWKKDLGFLDSGWFYDRGYQWGFGSSPIIFEDKVIVQCDIQDQSFVAAYRLSDGEEVWKTERDEIPGWSSPTVCDSPSGPMLLTQGTKYSRGYDARSGQELWKIGKNSEIVVPTPFVAHDLIFLASGYSPIQPIIAMKLDARGDISLEEDATTNEFVQWSSQRGGPYMPSPIVYGDYLYVCNNIGLLTCYQATTGKQVYKNRVSEGKSISVVGSPTAADGHLYITGEDGATYVIKAGPEFEFVGKNMIDEYVLTTAAISEGVFFLRAQRHLYALKEQAE